MILQKAVKSSQVGEKERAIVHKNLDKGRILSKRLKMHLVIVQY